MRRLIAALVLWLVVAPGAPSAMETDQYFSWGRPLADSTEAVNAKFNLELARAIASIPADRQPESCRKVAIAYRKRMRFLLMHEIPLLASASVAVMLTSQPSTYDCTTPCDFRGPFLEVEPGLGGKLSVGWTRVTGKTNRSGSFLKAAFIGAAYRATVLRTWGDYGSVEGGRTYAGLEFGPPVVQMNVDLGPLYRVDGGDDGPWMVIGGGGGGL